MGLPKLPCNKGLGFRGLGFRVQVLNDSVLGFLGNGHNSTGFG